MREKYYGIFRKNKKTGVIEGFTEHSFCMRWSEYAVLVYKSDNVLNDSNILSSCKNNKSYIYFIKRISKRDNKFSFKFKLFFSDRKRYLSGDYSRKFFARNIIFKINE